MVQPEVRFMVRPSSWAREVAVRAVEMRAMTVASARVIAVCFLMGHYLSFSSEYVEDKEPRPFCGRGLPC
jgi:hypothetical protein